MCEREKQHVSWSKSERGSFYTSFINKCTSLLVTAESALPLLGKEKELAAASAQMESPRIPTSAWRQKKESLTAVSV